MADIELVIKISEEEYVNLKNAINSLIENGLKRASMSQVCLAVLNGAPLPKGHGKLIDADVIINKLCTHEASVFFGSVTCSEILDFINNEKPIIEADKAESDDRE